MTPSYSQSEYLTILTHAAPDTIKVFAEAIIPQLGDITVLKNQTGLVMLPYTDSAQGTVFHLGEVLVAEAQVRLNDQHDGYALVVGRDVELALAIALIDAAVTAGIETERIMTLIAEQAAANAAADETLLRQVEATRVEMETF